MPQAVSEESQNELHVRWMSRALEVAREAGGRGEVPVGAVLVDSEGREVASAGNEAEVISRDPENWNERLLVNRGTADGVVTGAAVLVDGKVFGRVIRCYRHSSEVVTVLSSECRFGVAIANTSAVGVLQGRGDELLANGHRGFTVDYLPKDLSVESYQAVVTSGLGGWMPPGILVGTVVPDSNGRLIEYPEAARASVKCLPVAEFGAFHFLSIIVPDND